MNRDSFSFYSCVLGKFFITNGRCTFAQGLALHTNRFCANEKSTEALQSQSQSQSQAQANSSQAQAHAQAGPSQAQAQAASSQAQAQEQACPSLQNGGGKKRGKVSKKATGTAGKDDKSTGTEAREEADHPSKFPCERCGKTFSLKQVRVLTRPSVG